MKSTLIIPLSLLLLSTSCTPKLFKGMEKTDKQKISVSDLYPTRLEPGTTVTYTMKMNLRDNEMAGYLNAMASEDGKQLETVFTTIFGMTLFDVVLSEDKISVLASPPQVDQKSIIKVLDRDLRMLFFKNFDSESFEGKIYEEVYQSPESSIMTQEDKLILSKGYDFKNKYGHYRYKTNESEQLLSEIQRKSGMTKSDIKIDYQPGSQTPSKIILTHPKLGISLTLEPIQEYNKE